MKTALYVLACLSLVAALGLVATGAYWMLAQPDPQIVERDVSTIVDLNGAPLAEVVPGQHVWIRRDLEFTNKTSAEITRVFICRTATGAMRHYGLDDDGKPRKPPTVTIVRTVKEFPLVIPLEARGDCYPHIAAHFWKNPLQPKVRVPFQDVPIKVNAP